MGTERAFPKSELGGPMVIQNIAFMCGAQTGLQPLNHVSVLIQERTDYNYSFVTNGGSLLQGSGNQFMSSGHNVFPSYTRVINSATITTETDFMMRD